jgi:tetratricopeptide (TPR) repeat protein
MRQVLHISGISLAEGGMRRIIICCLVLLAWLGADVQWALAGGQGYPGGGGQGYPGGGGGMPGGRPGQGGMGPPGDEMPASTASTEKPDAAAKKAYNAGVKSLNKAREYEDVAAKATNPDKKAAALDKVSDAYGKALDQFTEALSNKGDMFEAWNNVGYVHLRLGAYNESIDDYNHALRINSELLEAVEHRAEAYVAVDRLDEAKAAYMDLFNHDRPRADQLMVVMQSWLDSHRAAANGMRPVDIDSFGKWLQERDGIAKQTASTAP